MKKKKRVKSEMAKRGSVGGKRSAARLTAQERTARARRAAAMRYGRERERDEREATQTAEEIRKEIKRVARELIDRAYDESGNAPVGSLAVELQRRFKFVLALKDAKRLIEGQVSWRGRNLATECHPVPIEQPPACEKCGSAEFVKPVFVGPWDEPGHHNLGDVIDGPIYQFWCERCDRGVGLARTLGK